VSLNFVARVGWPAGPAEGWYVSTTGTPAGDGSYADPWDIITALAHPVSVQPGDTIWLRGGTYTGVYKSVLTGTAANPIVVRNYANERVTIDGNVSTTLSAAITSAGQTSITLTNAAAIPVRSGMYLLIEGATQELVYVSNVVGNVLTVARGQDGSTASTHNSGVSVHPATQSMLIVEGGYTWYWGIEFTNTDLVRVTAIGGSSPYNARTGGVDVSTADGIRIINTVIHDAGSGWGVWRSAADFVGYGNLIYNNGWDSPDRLHGHGIYTQNETSGRLFSDNIIHSSFARLINQYGTDVTVLDNWTWEGNVLYRGSPLFGGEPPTNNLTLKDNYFYDVAPELAYLNRENVGLTMEGNYLPVIPLILWWTDVTVTGNTQFNRAYGFQVSIQFDSLAPPDALATYSFDNNQYYFTSPHGTYPTVWSVAWEEKTAPNTGGTFTLAQWQEEGQDLNSTLTLVAKVDNLMVVPDHVALRVNAYDPDRAHLIIYNWSAANTASVPDATINGFLTNGQSYRLRNVQDYYNDTIEGTYNGTALSVPMTDRTVALPVGYAEATWYHDPADTTTFPEFGVFVIEAL
jgi:hypothetical protein